MITDHILTNSCNITRTNQKVASRELCKPPGCLPLGPEEEAEVYPCRFSAGDETAFDLQATGAMLQSCGDNVFG